MKNVVVTGVLGQDGANMAEYLLSRCDISCKVYGMMRRSANPNFVNRLSCVWKTCLLSEMVDCLLKV